MLFQVIRGTAGCTPTLSNTFHPFLYGLISIIVITDKWALLPLLGVPFVMVFSQALGATIFFCQDEDTKSALVAAGAEEWSIYTRNELPILVAQNRVAPLSEDDLRKVHTLKCSFNARIVEDR